MVEKKYLRIWVRLPVKGKRGFSENYIKADSEFTFRPARKGRHDSYSLSP